MEGTPSVEAALGRLGPALRTLRKSVGKTQKEISEETGMSRSQVSRYEKGHDVPNLATLLKYLEAVGASFTSLDGAIHPENGDVDCAMSLAAAVRDVGRADPEDVDCAAQLAAAVRAVIQAPR